MFPERNPAAVGANVTLAWQLAPALSVELQVVFSEKSPKADMERPETLLALLFVTFSVTGALINPTW
ncbi:MAG: hypothetical protein ABSG65_09635 [Bryobacteraceae bacterium]|jgi:hypothetical protein